MNKSVYAGAYALILLVVVGCREAGSKTLLQGGSMLFETKLNQGARVRGGPYQRNTSFVSLTSNTIGKIYEQQLE